MEEFEIIARGLNRIEHPNTLTKAAQLEFAHEGCVTIRPERMAVRKAVARQTLSSHQSDFSPDLVQGAYRWRRWCSARAETITAVASPTHSMDNAPLPRQNRPARGWSSMAQYIYTMNRVSKVVPPKRTILKDISLSFFPGAKIGVLGLNGAGKSSLLRIMAGLDTNIEGEARPQSGIRIGFLTQEPELDASKDVRGNVMEGLGDTFGLLQRFNAISDKFAEPMSDDEMNKLLEEQAKLQDAIDAKGGWELERKLEIAADALRLPLWDARIDQLSGGEKRRVALCKLLLSQPDMLLLDEPTNHLDAESVAWLERYLEEYPSTVIAVTHDRYFLDNVASWILELDRGHGIPWEGNYSSWLDQKEKRLALEQREQDSLRKTLAKELEWVRQNPKARQAKSKARLARFEELQSKEFQERNETNEIYIPPGPRLGELVIEAKGLRKAFGDKLLFDNLSFNLPRGGIVGIIGPNGAGKTTLFRMLTGAEKPDAGEIRVGETVKLAYVDQSRQALDDKKSVWAEVSGGLDIIKVDSYETPSRAYLGRFNFKGNQQQQLVGELSGGERNRVHLAKMLKSGGNVLLLDEPTNDLDVETLRALEEALLTFPGCAVVISHDRWFLDRIATHILAFEGDSQVVWFEGNYQDYIEDLKRRRGPDADQPHRLKYRRLTG
jgi:ATP-binding cassette ChvD family protein